MSTITSGGAAPEVERAELDRHIAEIYSAVARARLDGLHFETGRDVAEAAGYSGALLDRLPEAAVASFAGVGHHLDLADLEPGERVLDLGSGSGTDAFAAAELVGPGGHVVGVDLTPGQILKAQRLNSHRHLRFHRARIEALPFMDESFDAVLSNGVLNLSPEKWQAFREAARVLRPGGRLALSDIVTDRRILARTAAQADLWAACIAGAAQRDDYLDAITDAGLELVSVRENTAYRFASERARAAALTYGARSVSLLARKPIDPTTPAR